MLQQRKSSKKRSGEGKRLAPKRSEAPPGTPVTLGEASGSTAVVGHKPGAWSSKQQLATRYAIAATAAMCTLWLEYPSLPVRVVASIAFTAVAPAPSEHVAFLRTYLLHRGFAM